MIEFSGLGDFIHLPVKTYSQGMQARLLFAVLTGGRHECLAMDEGFGAGDTSFMKKPRAHDSIPELCRNSPFGISLRRVVTAFLPSRSCF